MLRTWVREHSASCAKVLEFDCPAEVVPAEGKILEILGGPEEILEDFIKQNEGNRSRPKLGESPKPWIFLHFIENPLESVVFIEFQLKSGVPSNLTKMNSIGLNSEINLFFKGRSYLLVMNRLIAR